ncbi:hypothetical protein QWY85_18825 [Neolewinella lacunae]|uniref:Uncharacterized protein n=1 Tax=Neolewinella lacunae TaxID=1517758 RepID=A0A923T823_9BACT|nr:hypothetical protein [Neolewinella lacunae]MBC6994121.1 hypothetical protein [Neolewinella lacunae]MDN3636730.1 hypothetical protein [Neolewinella lacunae]
MAFAHVFVTHAILQERLTDAIIRQENLDPATVLVIRSRGSYRAGDTAAYPIRNGEEYLAANGRNLLRHRRTNRRRYAHFKAEVLDQVAPDFQVYAPMYTYWYINVLAHHAAAYHVLEDGFGSYQSREELGFYFNFLRVEGWRQQLRAWQARTTMVPGQRLNVGRTIALLDGVGRCYSTLPGCFPWAAPEKRVVVREVFPPQFVGEYTGAYVLGTSCLVESGYIALPVYLTLLRTVLTKIVARGITVLYVKLHPVQARHPENAPQYRAVLAEFRDQIELRELPQTTSIESLAAGNRITFITGISTLAFHVAATGSEVLHYHADILRLAPGATDYLAKTGVEIYYRIARPL